MSRDAGELFAEAEAVYLRMQAEMDKLARQGGAEELPPELARHVTGKLAEMLRELYRYWYRSGEVLVGEPAHLVWIRPHEETVDGSLVAIAVCTDGTGSGARSRDGTVKHGSAGINYVFFKDVDGALKGFTSKNDWVESC